MRHQAGHHIGLVGQRAQRIGRGAEAAGRQYPRGTALVAGHRAGIGSLDDIGQPRQPFGRNPGRTADPDGLGGGQRLKRASGCRAAVVADVVPDHRDHAQRRLDRRDQAKFPRRRAQRSHGQDGLGEMVLVVIGQFVRLSRDWPGWTRPGPHRPAEADTGAAIAAQRRSPARTHRRRPVQDPAPARAWPEAWPRVLTG